MVRSQSRSFFNDVYMSVYIRGTFFRHFSWPAQVAKWLETWGLSHKVPGSNPGPALKLTGGPEHWLGTALVPPLTHESTTDPHTSQRTAYRASIDVCLQ